jgi:hypothetical protein
MSAGVNLLMTPEGDPVVWNQDDATAKAEALRLGLLPALSKAVRKVSGSRVGVALGRDGDRLVAIVAWEGFASASENGWASLSVTPACDRTAAWLIQAAQKLANSNAIRWIPGGAAWRN